jgi:hypothetical protein
MNSVDLNSVDLAQPAFVFWMRSSRFQPGRVTRFDHLAKAIDCVMQHSFAQSAQVAWIKTRDRHLDMDKIRKIAHHSDLVGFLSKTKQDSDASKDGAVA